MPSQDAESLAELARLCGELRASLPDSGYHRLRVLLEMVLVDLAREGFGAQPEPPGTIDQPLSRNSP